MGAQQPRGRIARLGPTFFFVLGLVYLALLLLLAIGREARFWFLDDLHDPIAGVLPLGVPWFGALGAVTLSLYGVFDHNDHWDRKWNYWHLARPLVGIVLAIVAYFVFITLITSTGLTPRTSAATTSTTGTTLAPTTTLATTTTVAGQPGGTVPGPSTLLPYYVLAFLVGFREDTFRNLIKRAADVLLGPGDPGAPAAGIAVSPSPVDFGQVAVGGELVETVTVTNSGTGDLRVYPLGAKSPGMELDDRTGFFSLAANSVAGATIAPGANASVRVRFRPEEAGTHTATLTIASNAGTNPIDLRGQAVVEEQPAASALVRRLRRPRRRPA
jgi:hypothetical protein